MILIVGKSEVKSMGYWVIYKRRDGTLVSRENLYTDSLIKARSKIANAIDMNPNLSGGIYRGKGSDRLVGYIYFPRSGPIFMHRWVVKKGDTKMIYLLDYNGKIKDGQKA